VRVGKVRTVALKAGRSSLSVATNLGTATYRLSVVPSGGKAARRSFGVTRR
jgi:hypothetical protein